MCDLKSEQTNNKGDPIKLVSQASIKAFLENKNVEYFETSSKNDQNV